MSNWLKELLEEKSILWWFSVSTIMLFIFLIFVNQSSEKDLLGFLTESTFYVIEKEQDALEVGEEKVDLPVIEIEEKKEERKKTIGLKEKEKTILEKCNSLTVVMTNGFTAKMKNNAF